MQRNCAISLIVPRVVTGALLAGLGLTLCSTVYKEPANPPPGKTVTAHHSTDGMHQRLQALAGSASELKTSREAGKAGQQVGELWIQTEHLKQKDVNTRNVEGLLSDLEWNLRPGRQDSGARRRLANELEYEIQVLKRQNR